MNVSIVIPNYNGLTLLQKNLPRLLEVLRKDNAHAEIIVVDDASQDDSVSWLTSFANEYTTKELKLIIIQNETNKGFSHTANRGAANATGEFIVFLNTDVYPKKSFIENSIPHFKDQNVFAVGFMDESIEGGKAVLRGSGISLWHKGFYLHKKGDITANKTDWVSGGSGIFRRKVFEKLQGFNTIYDPFYWEDIDLSYRAKKLGYTVVFEPRSIVIHEHEKGAIMSKYSKQDVRRISYRNQFIFVWKNGSIGQLLQHLFWMPYHLALSLKNDHELFYGFLSAIKRFSLFSFLPQ